MCLLTMLSDFGVCLRTARAAIRRVQPQCHDARARRAPTARGLVVLAARSVVGAECVILITETREIAQSADC